MRISAKNSTFCSIIYFRLLKLQIDRNCIVGRLGVPLENQNVMNLADLLKTFSICPMRKYFNHFRPVVGRAGCFWCRLP